MACPFGSPAVNPGKDGQREPARRKAFPRAAVTRSITSLAVAAASYLSGIASGLKETEG